MSIFSKIKAIPSKIIAMRFKIILILIIVVICAIAVGFMSLSSGESRKEIITVHTLEKIVAVSELSIFESMYNGVCTVYNTKNTNNVDYHVAYEAKVKFGFNFEDVVFSVDNEAKVINATIPDIRMTDLNVDIGSLEFIFIDNKAKTSTVSAQAYSYCRSDVQYDIQNDYDIYILALRGAKNALLGLTMPFIKQLDSEYTFVIESSDGETL